MINITIYKNRNLFIHYINLKKIKHIKDFYFLFFILKSFFYFFYVFLLDNLQFEFQ